jgi:dolichyldiphosphatase
MDRSSLVIFTLTHVFYEKGNYVSFALAMTGLLPVVIVSCLLFQAWTTRRLQSCLLLFGLLANEALNNFLKHRIKEPRPEGMNELFGLETGRWNYGMPSAHTQFIFFFFAAYPLVLRDRNSPARRAFHFVAVAAITFGCAYSRAHFGYHTWRQVAVGAMLGAACGLAFRCLCSTQLCRSALDLIEESALGRHLRLHSVEHIGDTVDFEYQAARAAKKQAGLGGAKMN